MTHDVRIVPVSELEGAPNLAEFLAEYAKEAKTDGMPPPKVHVDAYHVMEKSGAMTTIGAFDGATVIGLIIMLVTIVPHYSVPVAHLESFFVAESHRNTGAGFRLLKMAEVTAKEKGAAGIVVSAYIGSTLDMVMSGKRNYQKKYVGYFRGLL
tara:strand:- start:631 stop:1089 length:459 start_codon:yes stop_codon:yes gene_type:complete